MSGVVGHIVGYDIGVGADATQILQVVAFVNVPRTHRLVFLFIRFAHFHFCHIAQGKASVDVGLHLRHSVYVGIARRYSAAIHRDFHLLHVRFAGSVLHYFNVIVVGAGLVAAIGGGCQEIVVDNNLVVDISAQGEWLLVEAQGCIHSHRILVGECVGLVFVIHMQGSNLRHPAAIGFFAMHHTFGHRGAVVLIRREADGVFVRILVRCHIKV